MLSITLILHSLLRWVVLATGLAAAARGFMGGKGRAWTAADSRAGLLFVTVLDLQFLLGLLLYLFLSPTVRTAFAVPGRVKAAASFHGGGLVTNQQNPDDPNVPIKLLPQTQASYLFAIAQNDDARAPAEKDQLKAAAEAAGRPAEIEVYKGDHGWTVPDSPVYNQAEADRAWERLLALYGTAL